MEGRRALIIMWTARSPDQEQSDKLRKSSAAGQVIGLVAALPQRPWLSSNLHTDEAHQTLIDLQNIVQPAGARPNDPVLYCYGSLVEGHVRDTVALLMDARYAMMSTVGSRTGSNGCNLPGNANARAHFDLLTPTIARAERVLVKGGNCYPNFGAPQSTLVARSTKSEGRDKTANG